MTPPKPAVDHERAKELAKQGVAFWEKVGDPDNSNAVVFRAYLDKCQSATRTPDRPELDNLAEHIAREVSSYIDNEGCWSDFAGCVASVSKLLSGKIRIPGTIDVCGRCGHRPEYKNALGCMHPTDPHGNCPIRKSV